MASSFAETIQLIAALEEMKVNKRRVRAQESQIEQQEAAARRQRIEQALVMAQSSVPEVRRAGVDLLTSGLGLNTEERASLDTIIEKAPLSPEVIKTLTINKGYERIQQNPEQLNAAALDAFMTLTSGQNQGQVAGSRLAADIAGLQQTHLAGLDPVMRSQLGMAGLSRGIAGVAPDAMAISASVAGNPALVNKAAGISAGGMTDAQAASADIGRGGVAAQFAGVNASMINNASDLAGRLASAKTTQGGALTPEQKMQGITKLKEIRESMLGKDVNDASRMQALAEYNTLAAIVDPNLIIRDPNAAPDRAGFIDRKVQGIIPPGMPRPAAPATAPYSPYTNPLEFLLPPAPYQPRRP